MTGNAEIRLLKGDDGHSGAALPPRTPPNMFLAQGERLILARSRRVTVRFRLDTVRSARCHLSCESAETAAMNLELFKEAYSGVKIFEGLALP